MTFDLGSKPQVLSPEASSGKKSEPKVSYPTLYVSNAKGLEGLPDGEFEFTGVGKVVHKSVSKRSGSEPSTSVEIEIKSIDCECDEAGEEDDIEGALDKIAAKKEVEPDPEDTDTEEEAAEEE